METGLTVIAGRSRGRIPVRTAGVDSQTPVYPGNYDAATMTHFHGGDEEDTQLPGQPVGHSYRRFEVLGTGAMGTVYRGEDRRGNHLAVKLLRAELAADPVVLARFIQERALLLRLASPNIVRVVDLVVEGDTVAIVMEKVDGGSLNQYLSGAIIASELKRRFISVSMCSKACRCARPRRRAPRHQARQRVDR